MSFCKINALLKDLLTMIFNIFYYCPQMKFVIFSPLLALVEITHI